MTWGEGDDYEKSIYPDSGRNAGGDSSDVEDKLKSGVKEVFSNYSAFAALKEDGSVVTWGDPLLTGDLMEQIYHHKLMKEL